MKRIIFILLFALPLLSQAQRKTDTYKRLIVTDSLKLNGRWYTALIDSSTVIQIINNIGLRDTLYVDGASGLYVDIDTLKQTPVTNSTPGYVTPEQKALWDAGGVFGDTSKWILNGTNIYNKNFSTRTVGIGTSTPATANLNVYGPSYFSSGLTRSDIMKWVFGSDTVAQIYGAASNQTAFQMPPILIPYNIVGTQFKLKGIVPGQNTSLRITDPSGNFVPGTALSNLIRIDGNYSNVATVTVDGSVFENKFGQANATVGQTNTLRLFSVNGTINNTAGTSSFIGYDFNPTVTASSGTSVIGFRNIRGNNQFNSSGGSSSFGTTNADSLVNIAGGIKVTGLYNSVASTDSLITKNAANGVVLRPLSFFKAASDSIGNTAFSQLWRLNKVRDSLQTNIDTKFSSSGTKTITGKTTINWPVIPKDSIPITTSATPKWAVTIDTTDNSLKRFQLQSGTYTPTTTGVANTTSITGYTCQYIRVGNIVTVSGNIDITATAGASTLTQVGISLPIASNFTAATGEGSGTGVSEGGTGNRVYLKTDATNDRMSLEFLSQGATAQGYRFQFQYEIK